MAKNTVSCAYCGASLLRYPVKTDTYFCNKNCKGLWQKKQRENLGYTKDWLYHEYIELGKSANDIARDIGRDPKRVWEWIVDYGIPTRPRGSDERQWLKKGNNLFKGHHHTDATKQKIREDRLRDGRIPCYVNGVHWMKAYNRKPASWKGGITPERQAFYATNEWMDAKYSALNRDKKTCQKCGIKYGQGVKLHLHHIVSFSNKKLRCDIDNLITLCENCHWWVHSSANVDRQFIKEGE